MEKLYTRDLVWLYEATIRKLYIEIRKKVGNKGHCSTDPDDERANTLE